MKIYRQGDVLLKKISVDPKDIPEGATDVTPKDGRIVLAYGEVTGHAHAFAEPEVKAGKLKALSKTGVWDPSAERFIQVLEKTALTHEEHSPVELDKGIYEVVQQREYSPEEIRRVAD